MADEETIEFYADADAMACEAAQRLARLGQDAVAQRGVFTVALSGGSTPRRLYRLLANDPALRSAIPWSHAHFFFGDERPVPPDHADSNYRLANENLFRHLDPGLLRVHRVPAELPDAREAATRYEADLRQFFQTLDRAAARFPRFDLIFLGMGSDGHTASLFPGSPALQETNRWILANWIEKLQTHRITMTLPVLNAATEVMLLVAGADKAAMVAEVLERTAGLTQYPVQMVRPLDGRKRWLLDQAAASQLTRQMKTSKETLWH